MSVHYSSSVCVILMNFVIFFVMFFGFFFFFFFSSRRRHTRCGRDWSSDVCSSDLTQPLVTYCSTVYISLCCCYSKSLYENQETTQCSVVHFLKKPVLALWRAPPPDRKSVV